MRERAAHQLVDPARLLASTRADPVPVGEHEMLAGDATTLSGLRWLDEVEPADSRLG